MNQTKLLVSPSPHIRSNATTQQIMLDVILALVPSCIASVILFGVRSLAVIATCVVVCIGSEWGFEKLCKRPNTLYDLSAVVTGILLALNLPSTIPLWQAVFGSMVAIIVVKQLFGGIGKNFANPAITARIVMLLSFSGTMSAFSASADAVSSATPLGAMKAGEALPSLMDLFLGKHGGSLGETCVLAIVIGGIYLLIRRVITWHTPVVFIGTVFLFTWLLGENPLEHILTGGLMLGAFFMATDYSTTPSTKMGESDFRLWLRADYGFDSSLCELSRRRFFCHSVYEYFNAVYSYLDA